MLTGDEYTKCLVEARMKFFPFSANKSVCRDISDLSPPAVRGVLSDWMQASQAPFSVLWLGESAGVVIEGERFIAHYDDLWYPGSDDVWVLSPGSGTLIMLSHEEELCLVRPR
jgi:hypothetical protein